MCVRLGCDFAPMKGEDTVKQIQFIDIHGSFTMENPENTSYLYFPLASETGLKSSITPNLNGDAKINQDSFLLEPVSSENLHNNRSGRNFWCVVENFGVYSAAGVCAEQEAAKFSNEQDASQLTAGFMWHTLKRNSKKFPIASAVTSFIPPKDNVEIMHVSVKNTSDFPIKVTAYAAIPIYGRSADNLRDHRHVTSLLHRISVQKDGVYMCPTMSFDERGHHRNHRIYYVSGFKGDGKYPDCFYPTVESFIGEGGTFTHPRAIYESQAGVSAPFTAEGKEAMGAFRFESVELHAHETAEYIVLLGSEESESAIRQVTQKYNTSEKVLDEQMRTKEYWQDKVNVDFYTQDKNFNGLMKWVSFQPFLRRLFGCSFLPHHDYGRGGRGWRDLWQDCLSLLLMNPQDVGEMIAKNYGGVRIDGTNATIIGEGDGNFIADRNGIMRVWMDHALWPLMTTKLYIDQTGDVDILNRTVTYFKDKQMMRGTAVDSTWSESDGSQQRTVENEIYEGSILEHLLIQQLTAFYDVGNHNIYRLHGADWNDALDMAAENGESVAFTCAYAGNLTELATMILYLDSEKMNRTVDLLEEIKILLNTDVEVFESVSKKQEVLKEYTSKCCHRVSGKRVPMSLASLAANLVQKATWLTQHVRSQEWIEGTCEEGWFNSYYDNHEMAVDGYRKDHVRMMLTGQVFAIMGDIATSEQICKIVKSADHYLYEPDIGGYRLNTNFHELKFDMGRMFGFAYGEKENGAVFSHMAVMYANALYRREFAKEGWNVLKSLANTALDFDTSRIYPGIPEYFRSDGRGMYHYLTGAASWYLMTMITEVFGVRGVAGDLVIHPKLLAEQFNSEGIASIAVDFAGKRLKIAYVNLSRKEFGNYILISAFCEEEELTIAENSYAMLPREKLKSFQSDELHITLILV